MLAAFRGALERDEDTGVVQGWIVNPVLLFREIGDSLYRAVLDSCPVGTKFNLSALGRLPSLYGELEQMTGRAAERAARKGKYAVSSR